MNNSANQSFTLIKDFEPNHMPLVKDILVPSFENLLTFKFKRKIKLDVTQTSMDFHKKHNSFKAQIKKQASIYSVKSPLKPAMCLDMVESMEGVPS